MKNLIVNTQEEFNMMVDCSDFRIIEAIVEGALTNIKTTKRFIHILSISIEEDNEVYDLTLERCEFLDNLKKNLKHYEKKELYEKCKEIVEAIKFLEIKPQIFIKRDIKNKENAN